MRMPLLHTLTRHTAAVVLLTTLVSAHAVSPQRVILDTYADFAEGDCLSTSLTDTGIIAPAPEVSKLGDIDAAQVWSILSEKDGKFLLGTSPDGKLLRMDESGKCTLVTKFAESHIYALARNAAGEIFVATSPDGKIFKLQAKEKPVVYFEPKEKYIWSLAFDKNGVLYAATGTNGRVYRITAEGKGEIYYDSDETHLRSLAFDKDGNLLAGSADSGYLYRISKSGEGVVLYSTSREEVNHIAVGPDGAIYFSAVGNTKGTAAAPASTPPSTPAGLASFRGLLGNGDSDNGSKTNGSGNHKNGSSKSKSGTVRSQLFRLDPATLSTTEIWHTGETIFTLDFLGSSIFAGTGNDGYFYAITPRGQVTRLLKVESESLSAVTPLSGGRWALASSNPARVYLAGGARSGVAVYESDVIDSGSFARWGSIQLKAQGTVDLLTRSGNTPKPDKSWYPWTPLQSAQTQSPAARYLQIQLKLHEATVDRVELVYLAKNAPPHIERVDVLPPGIGYLPLTQPPPPPQPKSPEQLLAQVAKPEDALPVLPTRFQPSLGHGQRTLVWKASDPNGDQLTYIIYQRSDGSPQWHVVADEYKDTVLSWDSTGWPDGQYYFKVVASDAPDNTPSTALTDELISRIVTIDNTPPAITILATGNGKARFRVTDSTSLLTSVTTSKNGREFEHIQPVDGILDARSEEFEVPLPAGETLFIRAEDEFGNAKGEKIESPADASLIKK